MENEAEENEAKQQQQNDDEQYDTVPRIKFVYKGILIKEFRVPGNLSTHDVNTRIIIATLTPCTEMWAKIIYSFESEIYEGAGEIVLHSETLASPPGMFNSLVEIQGYI